MPATTALIGKTISHYRILEAIGSGGMGEVFKAQDLELGRLVALKFLSEDLARDADVVERFRREARAASVLNHPGICTIYEIAQHEGQYFLAMELLDGETMRERIGSKSIQPAELLDFATQIADALEAAHTHGVIHRDVTPANIFVTDRGRIKILDFGLAKLIDAHGSSGIRSDSDSRNSEAATQKCLTAPGAYMGTVAYMSPEQVRGEVLDPRTDIFSFGTVLYEMSTGRRPFVGGTSALVFDSILHSTPASLRAVNPAISVELDRIIHRALEKDRSKRFASAAEMRSKFEALRQQGIFESSGDLPLSRLIRKPSFIAGALLVLTLAGIVGGLYYRRHSRIVWLHEQALPEILQLVKERKGIVAYRLIKQAERIAPRDPALEKLKAATLWQNDVLATPSGAEIFVKDYSDVNGPWEYLGKTPLQGNRLPHAFYRFKLSKSGYETMEVTGTALEASPVNVILDPVGSLPRDMVRVPQGEVDPTGHSSVAVDTFLIDKFEVRNREYKAFVDAGGYRDAKYWKVPFSKDRRTLSFDEAMLLFRDKTGRPGPATWELSNYLQGEADYPVTGVSWFEAAAYAQFAGKSLPTVFHWYRAADMGRFSDILQLSNFAGKGPAKVGSGLGPFGTYDMAGNVKEWCLNSDGDRKYVLGGASTDPPYMYQEPDARTPFDRSVTHGMRLVKYLRSEPLPQSLTAPVSFQSADYRKAIPVADAIFNVYRSLYSYDRIPLDAKIESEDDSSSYWRRQRVTFNAAYGNERVIAYLFLPKNASPPFQTVVYFPHGGAQTFHAVEDTQLTMIDFLVKSGHALAFPIYKNTYERLGTPPDAGTNAERDETIQQAKDLNRTIDYLETRPDFDTKRLAYYGVSWGATLGPIMTAMEPRIKTAIFAAGGCDSERVLPEVDPMNFAPRVKIPVIMINGRYDFVIPLETCQEPLFKLLGTPALDKRHVLFDTGHSPPQLPVEKEALDWLDRYLGPVK